MVERYPDTVDVTSSSLVVPTRKKRQDFRFDPEILFLFDKIEPCFLPFQ